MATKADKRAAKPSGKRRVISVDTQSIRKKYGLSRPTFGRMVGVSEATVARWEQGKGHPDAARVANIRKAEEILRGLARVMRMEFIATWLDQPNDACKELGVLTPLDLLARGAYASLEDMIFYFESGVPS